MEKRHIEILVEGKIRNIGFAFQIMRAAETLNIFGYTKYTSENSAKVVVEGDTIKVNEFINWCKTAFPEAGNINIKITPNNLKGFKKFTLINY